MGRMKTSQHGERARQRTERDDLNTEDAGDAEKARRRRGIQVNHEKLETHESGKRAEPLMHGDEH